MSNNQLINTVTVSVVTLILLCSIVNGGHGGLLSNYLSARRSHYYIVQKLDDIVDNNPKLFDAEEQKNDEGTVTSSELVVASGENIKTSYADCGSTAHIETLALSPCVGGKAKDGIGSGICEIKRGSNATFSVSFVPKENTTQLRAVIHGIVDYIPIPFPSPQPDACHNSGIVCPLEAGRKYDYVLSAPIKESYPKMKLWIKGQLEDQNGGNVICVKIHVRVV